MIALQIGNEGLKSETVINPCRFSGVKELNKTIWYSIWRIGTQHVARNHWYFLHAVML